MMIILIIMMISILMTITKTTSDVRDACSTADITISNDHHRRPHNHHRHLSSVELGGAAGNDLTEQRYMRKKRESPKRKFENFL